MWHLQYADSVIDLLTVLTCCDRQKGHCGGGIGAASDVPGTPTIDLIVRAWYPCAVKWIFVGTPGHAAAPAERVEGFDEKCPLRTGARDSGKRSW